MSLTPHHLAGLGFLAACWLVGSQAEPLPTVGGQALPSPWDFGLEDIVYFPAGPEFQLPNAVQATEEYKAAQLSGDDEPYNPRP